MSHSVPRKPKFTDDRHLRMVQAMNAALNMAQEEIGKACQASFSTVNAWVAAVRIPRRAARDKIEVAFKASLGRAWGNNLTVQAMCAVLHVEYGSPRLGNLDDPLDELFFILCSLKTSFLTYEETYGALASKFRPWSRLLDSRAEDVAETIRRGGFGSLKAKAFVDIAYKLQQDFGEVSLDALRRMSAEEAESYLRSLPGVGLKTARCVLLYALNVDTVPVDTHTYRVAVRLGIIPTSKNPDAAHEHFDRVTPAGLGYMFHVNLVAHGRAVCKDLRPECGCCVLLEHCPTGQKTLARKDAENAPSSAPRPTSSRQTKRPVAVDMYAGCGGLSLGLRHAGFNVAYALDWDAHACETHRANLPEAIVDCADVRSVAGAHILAAAGGRVDLVAGGPNCQGVSQRGLRSPDDPRNFMFPEFLRVVEHLSPKMFLMENVPGLAHRHNYTLLRDIFSAFERLGYKCAGDVLLAADYGAPQLRYRFFLIGTLGNEPLGFPASTHSPAESLGLFSRPYVTIREAISDLPSIVGRSAVDEPLLYKSEPTSDYQRLMRKGAAELVCDHRCSATDEVNLRRASHIPEGGNWKDIPPELLPARFFECRLTDHSTTYARPRWDMPSFTVTALLGNITAGAFTHPAENRAFSVREGARLQSFPDTFRFHGPLSSKYRQVGNAVPPLLAQAVGEHLLKLLRGEKPAFKPARITRSVLNDQRSWDALPVLTPRFKTLFGTGTRWPKGWGAPPAVWATALDDNYRLRSEFRPKVEDQLQDCA